MLFVFTGFPTCLEVQDHEVALLPSGIAIVHNERPVDANHFPAHIFDEFGIPSANVLPTIQTFQISLILFNRFAITATRGC
jgi:hypothetical protein